MFYALDPKRKPLNRFGNIVACEYFVCGCVCVCVRILAVMYKFDNLVCVCVDEWCAPSQVFSFMSVCLW